MTQPSGKVLGLPSKYSFHLNISPFVCAVNALDILLRLLLRCWRTRSFNAAARSIANDLFDVEENRGHTRGLAQLQEIWQVRLVVFIFGALPQIIKLYAMRGITGTQVLASLYLGSFVVLEAVIWALEDFRNSAVNQDDRIETIPWFGTRLPDRLGTYSRPAPGRLQLSSRLPQPGTDRAMPVYGIDVILNLIRILTLVTSLIIPGYLIPILGLRNDLGRLIEYQDYMNGAIVFSFVIPGSYTFRFREDNVAGRPLRLRPYGHIVFTSIHALAAILTYGFVYKPLGTYRPEWTNQLG